MKKSLALISRIHEKGNRFITEQLKKNGIDGLVPSHGDILAVLYKYQKSTMKDIADRIHRTKPTVTVLVDKLEKLDVKSYTAEQLSIEQLKEGISAMDSKLYWANEYEMTGAAGHYLQDNNIDGIITINAFGCGPDSIMVERISRAARPIRFGRILSWQTGIRVIRSRT